MKRKTILFIEQYPIVRGGQTVFLDLLEIGVDIYDHVSAAFPVGGDLEKEVLERFPGKVDIYSIPEVKLRYGRKGIKDILKVVLYSISFIPHWRYLRRFDVWYVNGGRMLVPLALAAIFLRRTMVFHAHLNHKKYEKRLLVHLCRLGVLREIVCVSRFVYEGLKGCFSLIEEDRYVWLVENALSRSMSTLCFENRFVDEKRLKRIAVVGQLSESKGQEMIPPVARRFPSITFYLIGGAARDETGYEEKIKETAPKNVVMYGEVRDVARTLSELGVQMSIVPSQWEEPFGLVAIESMASSCITLSTGKGGLREIAELTGMITFEDTDSLINKIEEMNSFMPGDLKDIAMTQYAKTISHYQYQRFAGEMRVHLSGL